MWATLSHTAFKPRSIKLQSWKPNLTSIRSFHKTSFLSATQYKSKAPQTRLSKKVLRWTKIGELPNTAVRPDVFYVEDQKKVIIRNPNEHVASDPIAWEMDPEFYNIKPIAKKQTPDFEVDPAKYDYLPIHDSMKKDFTKLLHESLNGKLNGSGDPVRAATAYQNEMRKRYGNNVLMADYYADPKAVGAFVKTSKVYQSHMAELDVFTQHFEKIIDKYFGDFVSNTKFSEKFENLIGGAAEKMELFSNEVDVVLKLNEGKSPKDVFIALAKHFDLPVDSTLIQKASELIDLPKLVSYLRKVVNTKMENRFDVHQGSISTADFNLPSEKLSFIVGLARDITFQAYTQKLSDAEAFSKDPSLVSSDWENPVTPDAFNFTNRWDKTEEKIPETLLSKEYVAFSANYQRNSDELVRELSKRFDITTDEVTQYAKARIAKKTSVFQARSDFEKYIKLISGLETANERFNLQLSSEELKNLNSVLKNQEVWDRAEEFFTMGKTLGAISNDFLRVRKVKFDSPEKTARFRSVFERAVEARFAKKGIDVQDLELDLTMQNLVGRSFRTPIIEYPYDSSVQSGNKLVVFNNRGLETAQPRAGIITVFSGKLDGTELPTPPFAFATATSLSGKVFAIGYQWKVKVSLKPKQHDVWVLDTLASNPTWEKLETNGTPPLAHIGSDIYSVNAGKEDILYFAAGINGYEIYRFNTKTNTWDKPTIQGNSPVPLVGASLSRMKMHGEEKIVALFGSVQNDFPNHPNKHMAIFDVETLTWEPSDPEFIGDIPEPRKESGLAFYPEDEVLFVVGGRTEAKTFNDIYMLHIDREAI